MTRKYKIITSVVASVLVLIIAGLAIGLVLVAQQVQMTNSVSVTYKANNVNCEITSWGLHFLGGGEDARVIADTALPEEDTDTKKAILIDAKDSEGNDITLRSVTDVIHAYENEGTNESGQTIATREHSFQDVVMQPVADYNNSTASSEVGYYFKIKNTGPNNITITLSYTGTEDNIWIWCCYEDSYNVGENGGLDDTLSDLILAPEEEGLVAFVMCVTDINQDANYTGNLIVTIENGGEK
ncbi:MAG: hypothetical protein IJA61_00485 [Clostridia bacterium]|nr:hypothetical protein [Clostridia bacterium]